MDIMSEINPAEMIDQSIDKMPTLRTFLAWGHWDVVGMAVAAFQRLSNMSDLLNSCFHSNEFNTGST